MYIRIYILISRDKQSKTKKKDKKTKKAKETKEEKRISVENLTGYNDIEIALCTFNLFDRS